MLSQELLLSEYELDINKPINSMDYTNLAKNVKSVQDLLDIEEAWNEYCPKQQKEIKEFVIFTAIYNGYQYPDTTFDSYKEYDTYFVERIYKGKVFQYDTLDFNKNIDASTQEKIYNALYLRNFPLDGFMVSKCISSYIDCPKDNDDKRLLSISSSNKDEIIIAKTDYTHLDCANKGILNSTHYDKETGLESSNIHFEKAVEDGVNIVKLDAQASKKNIKFTSKEVITEKKSFYMEYQQIKRDEKGFVTAILLKGERKSNREEFFKEDGLVEIKRNSKKIKIEKNINSINISKNPDLKMREKQIVLIDKELNKIIVEFNKKIPLMRLKKIKFSIIAGKLHSFEFTESKYIDEIDEFKKYKECSLSYNEIKSLKKTNSEEALKYSSLIKDILFDILDIQLPAQGHIGEERYDELNLKMVLQPFKDAINRYESSIIVDYVNTHKNCFYIGSFFNESIALYNNNDEFVANVDAKLFDELKDSIDIYYEKDFKELKNVDIINRLYKIEIRENKRHENRVSTVIEYLAQNPKTPLNILRDIAKKRYQNILYVDENCIKGLLLNKSTPIEIIKQIIESENHLDAMKDELATCLMATRRIDISEVDAQNLYLETTKTFN